MKVFQYKLHGNVKLGVAEDEKDAFERRAEIDRAYQFLPVKVEELKFEGYEIVVMPLSQSEVMSPDHINKMDKEELKEYLNAVGVEFHHALGETKLRELALANV